MKFPIYSEKCRFTLPVWIKICIRIAEAIKQMHYCNILHNDIKSNNILLKIVNDQDVFPKICDVGKATHTKKPPKYNLGDKEKLNYNAKYTYIAYELRNSEAFKSTYSDIFPLGAYLNL